MFLRVEALLALEGFDHLVRVEPEKARVASQETDRVGGAGNPVEAPQLQRLEVVLLNAQHVSGVGHAVAAPLPRFAQLVAEARNGALVVAARLVDEPRPDQIRLGCL